MQYFSEAGDLILQLHQDKKQTELEIIKTELLKQVYANFLIFAKSENTSTSSRELIKKILNQYGIIGIDDELIFDVSNELSERDASLFGLIKDSSYRHPILLDQKDPIVKSFGELFESTSYDYLCVVNREREFLLFTGLDEKGLDELAESLGLKLIELHSIIPIIINNISEDVRKGKISLNELGISFPLSMLGGHSYISGKLKNGMAIQNDTNFRNLIKYGLLDKIKLKKKYTIGFNKSSNGNKFRLYGFLYQTSGDEDAGEQNKRIRDQLDSFLADIEVKIDDLLPQQQFNLPIYVIADKQTHTKTYPYFKKTNDDLYLKFPNGKEFRITGIYPRYTKTCTKGDNYVLCIRSDVKTGNHKLDIEIGDLFKKSDEETAKKVIDTFIAILREKYSYENDGNSGNKTHLREVDILLTATDVNSPKDTYIVNFTGFKNESTKLTLELYKLCGQELTWDEIVIKNKKFQLIEKESIQPIINGFSIKDNVSIKYTLRINKNKFRDVVNNYSGDGKIQINDLLKSRINKEDYLSEEYYKQEDFISLCLIDILQSKGIESYFGGKSRNFDGRELADIISVETSSEVNSINLFHIKKPPFYQKSGTVIQGGFSLYTEVLGQVFQKLKPVLFEDGVENIRKGFLDYFKDEKNCIFQAISKALDSSKRIDINILFPVRYEDYFFLPDEEISNQNRKLAIETNWKTTRMAHDIFNANVSSIAIPGLNLKLNLKMMVCRKSHNIKASEELCSDIYLLDAKTLFE